MTSPTYNRIARRSPKAPSNSHNSSLGLKLIIVCALVMLMAIPAMFISYIAFERSNRADEVMAEVSQRYGGEQFITGPMIIAPYVSYYGDGTVSETGHYAVFAEHGKAEFKDMVTTVRKRSLFKVPTYDTKAVLSASFAAVEKDIDVGDAKVDWSKAKIIVALSDVRGLTRDVSLTLPSGESRKFHPADTTESANIVRPHAYKSDMRTDGRVNGRVIAKENVHRQFGWLQNHGEVNYLSAPVGDLVSKGASFDVSVDMALSGARRLGVTPFAQSTEVVMSSDWADPGFEGGFPPLARDITETGFSANWSVPYLRRGIRAHGKAHSLGALNAPDKMMTVQLVSTQNPYQTVNRALKYSVLFIGMVFLAYFLFEVLVGVQVHPAQYILIGLTQSIFYLLLLAFSERIGFGAAFAVSSAATVIATAAYAGAVFKGRKYIARAGAVFALVYGLLYCLMRMQDFALMIGALASFLAIAATMYLTRNMDWYGLNTGKAGDKAEDKVG